MDYRHAAAVFKVEAAALLHIGLVCLQLRNDLNTMDPNQTGVYSRCAPPTFKDWL